MTESLLLALGGAIVGCLFSYAGIKGLVALIPEDGLIPSEVRIQLNLPALLFSLGAAVGSALLFGLVHLANMRAERNPWRLLAEVLITGLGGAFFAWLLVRWDNNLWIPIAMHVFMNLWWEVFAVDRTAIGSWAANGARACAIATAIVITLLKTRRVPISRRTSA